MHRFIIAGMNVLILGAVAHAGVTLHVKGANGSGPGTSARPMGLREALKRVAADGNITEVVLADGLYEGNFQILPPKDHKGELPRLTVRAAVGATPLFRHAMRITEAEEVEGKPGLYRIKRLPPSDPQMWERDTRVRYFTLSNAGSVAAYPGSCFDDRAEGYLYFRTSDGKPPASHDLWLALCSRNSRALYLRRPNTTIEGLHFVDYVAHNGLAIQSYGDNVHIRNCRFENCETAWGTNPGTKGCLMENCVGVDVARGVYSHSEHIIIRGNRFEKTRDRFLYPLYPQNDSAYQVYHPGRGGIIEGNFCKGYRQAIFIKAQAAPYIIRHNTVVDSHMAIGFSSGMKDGCVVSHNIVVDARSFLFIDSFRPDSIVDHNVLWQPREIGQFEHRMRVIRGAGCGKHNVLADPRFADPANNDYRVLPDSLAVALADKNGQPAGAFGVADFDDAKSNRPTLSLAFRSDSKPFGATGDYTFDRDPWIGGGTTHIRELSEEGVAKRLTGKPTLTVRPLAYDIIGKIAKLRIAIDGKDPTVVDYDDRYKLTLPDVEGNHDVVFAVQNDRGQWSEPVKTVLRLDRAVPKLTAAPEVIANAHGFAVYARTDEACFAELHYGSSSEALIYKVQAQPRITRFWDANDGGEWVEAWRVPRTEHRVGVLQPETGKGGLVYAKLVFTDQAGLSSESAVLTVKVAGTPRTLRVADEGMSLQTAVDLALPGDRILVAPGVYTDDVFISRGGVEGAPITVEAEKPGTVTLDGAKRVNALIHLESAPHVTIRGLRILYFKKAGIYAYRSPNTTVDACTFYNGPGWATGYHVFAFWSPRTTVANNLAVGAEIGFYFLKSPYATVLHNTASQHMYAAASYPFSLEGSTQMYNSFTYAGNDIYHAEMSHPKELETFRSDYNNLGTDILGHNTQLKQTNPDLYARVKKEAFPKPKYDVYIRTASKAVIGVGKRYLTLKEWQGASGKDLHSIFADPRYIRPYVPIDRWDWRVKPDSPNLKVRDEDGKPIGAFGAEHK